MWPPLDSSDASIILIHVLLSIRVLPTKPFCRGNQGYDDQGIGFKDLQNTWIWLAEHLLGERI